MNFLEILNKDELVQLEEIVKHDKFPLLIKLLRGNADYVAIRAGRSHEKAQELVDRSIGFNEAVKEIEALPTALNTYFEQEKKTPKQIENKEKKLKDANIIRNRLTNY